MPAVTAAALASSTADLYIIIGNRSGVVYRFQKGSFSPTAPVLLASASKLLAGVTIMRLVDRGVMRLDDHPQRYLPWWTTSAADSRSQVTLQQLLSFTSGFNSDESTSGCYADAASTTAACARSLYDAGVATPPGASFAYGPAHMTIAAAMAAAATGKSWNQIVADEVTTPLGMTATVNDFPSPANPRIAGGASSTIEDYARLMAAMLGGNLVVLPNFIQDRTAGTATAYTPIAPVFGDWHYALGSWRECDAVPFASACASQQLVSSPGAFGWTPWIDLDRGYWAIIGMQQGAGGSVESVRLEQQIQPLIGAALGTP